MTEEKRRDKKLLILGDSHAHVFALLSEDIGAEVTLVKRSSCTAYGINNPNSETQSNKFFLDSLKDEKQQDYICFHLGEVDCRSLTHKKGLKNYKETLTQSVNNLVEFIRTNLTKHPPQKIVLLHPPQTKSVQPQMNHPKHTPDAPAYEEVSLRLLTNFTFYFCDKLDEAAARHGWISFGINNEILDPKTGIVRKEMRERVHIDKWHLDRTQDIVRSEWIKKIKQHLF